MMNVPNAEAVLLFSIIFNPFKQKVHQMNSF